MRDTRRLRFHVWSGVLALVGVGLIALSILLYSTSWFEARSPRTDYFGYSLDQDWFARVIFWGEGIAPGLCAVGIAAMVAVLFRAAPSRPSHLRDDGSAMPGVD